jgi:hypothetical protein
MSLNDLMPHEDIIIGDGASGEGGFSWDNPFAHSGSIPELPTFPFPSDPISNPINPERNLVNSMSGGNTSLPIKHPKK